MLVSEAYPSQSGEGCADDQRRVQQDQAGLCYQGIFKDEQSCTHAGGECAAAQSLEGQEHGGDGEDTKNGWQHAHGDIGHLWLEVVLANILEVEAAVEASAPTSQSDQQLGEWRVDVHEELALDVLAGEATKVDLIEDDAGGLVDSEQPDGGADDCEIQQDAEIPTGQQEDIIVLDAFRGIALALQLALARLLCDGPGRL